MVEKQIIYLSRQNPITALRGGGFVNEIKSGSFVSVLHELVELFLRNEAGGGAINAPPPPPPCPPKFASGRGRGFNTLPSVSVIETKHTNNHEQQ